MSPSQFRHWGKAVIDQIADYWEETERHPVLSAVEPGDLMRRLPDAPPEAGEPFSDVLADVRQLIMPGITHWRHPSFFGYFPATTSGPSVLGDLLGAGLNVQGMLWSTSPACTELEAVACRWLGDLLGLPHPLRDHGIIQGMASTATIVAMVAALSRAGGGEWRVDGARKPYVIYASPEANYTVRKAARVVGVGDGRLRLIDLYGLREEAARDRAAGLVPAGVIATIGTTSTAAIDPVRAAGEACRDLGLWLHVDAAYAGAAAACPELRWVNDGVELADSYCVNPYKWLLTGGFDCAVMWLADPADLTRALSLSADYLSAPELGEGVPEYRDWQLTLGRPFRSLKLWMTLRWYGVQGVREHIRAGVGMAREFASWVRADDRFEVVSAGGLGLVCFRLRASDEVNMELLRRLNASGELFLTETRVSGRYVLRMAIGGTATTIDHVRAAWDAIRSTASAVLSAPNRAS